MSESDSEQQPDPDEELVPDDLRPSEDNPLAQPLPEDADRDDLDMHGGRPADESDDSDDVETDEGED